MPLKLDARELIGLRTADAERIARRHGCHTRVMKRDGQELEGFLDLQLDRINLAIEQDVVRGIEFIG